MNSITFKRQNWICFPYHKYESNIILHSYERNYYYRQNRLKMFFMLILETSNKSIILIYQKIISQIIPHVSDILLYLIVYF